MSSSEVEESGGLVERAKADRAAKRNWFSQIILFVQQVFAELKKVVTPTRKELVRYTIVVIAFVVIMMALVWALDQVFGFITVFIFGTPLG
ncbi:preprotein translocase subunit SecE [Leucobacter luti]|uniref:Protein translocase subunit SecE n=1 Tax=Leucobacter luti TaxID=340320 RepID=A0A4Q7TQU1_9MICO|nr:preprotein translocase subunit SecE [Leucobacter luti]MBL3699788.1 preprotein translocase subunit SecE [Leucobacter luti]RZT62893.1 preprotein translocase subunit SecE [Leucobacter luti]